MMELTGSWYESNVFSRVVNDIEFETDDLSNIIGDALIEKAQSIYTRLHAENNLEEAVTQLEKVLLRKVQLPIAIMASYHYYQSNIVAHETTSRVVKVNAENEKLAWEWMLDRDDQAHLKKAQRAIDNLIDFLDKNKMEQWVTSEKYLQSKSLFVNNTEVFGRYFPIDNSARFYYLAEPILREVQNLKLKKSLGEDYEALLSGFQADSLSDAQQRILDHARRAQVLFTIAIAVDRLAIQVLPEGVVKKIKSASQSVNSNSSANLDELKRFTSRMLLDAEDALNEIKKIRNADSIVNARLIPENNPSNKFART
ncbi:DUF6712 family protein [Rhinopithecimicrobium faecis]